VSTDVPTETEHEIDRAGNGVLGELQAEVVVGFYRTLREGGVPRRLAGQVLRTWVDAACRPDYDDDVFDPEDLD
jgi:hypothetical protein